MLWSTGGRRSPSKVRCGHGEGTVGSVGDNIAGCG